MIDLLPDAPDPAVDIPVVFSQKAAALVLAQKAMVSQINDTILQFSALAAGGAYALPYVFDAATADADPGPGKLRLSSATQNASTTLRLDLLAAGQDVTSILDTFDASTNGVKGSVRLVKVGDLSKWLTFDVTARASATGYRNITVVNTGGSAASPFAAGDGVILLFQRAGNQGNPGAPGAPGLSGFSNMVVARTTQTWTAPAGVTKAKFTVIDGGSGAQNNSTTPGTGGNASVSIRAVTPSAAHTLSVGAGGAGNGGGGGTSSVSGSGFTTLTAANGDFKVAGGLQGDSLYASTMGPQIFGYSAVAPGQGGAYSVDGGGQPGAAGAVIVEY
ncbi:MAG: hypothetical protein ACRYGO_07245 [Janthinobacterium lividum]